MCRPHRCLAFRRTPEKACKGLTPSGRKVPRSQEGGRGARGPLSSDGCAGSVPAKADPARKKREQDEGLGLQCGWQCSDRPAPRTGGQPPGPVWEAGLQVLPEGRGGDDRAGQAAGTQGTGPDHLVPVSQPPRKCPSPGTRPPCGMEQRACSAGSWAPRRDKGRRPSREGT